MVDRKIYQEALDVQDAVNLTAVAGELHRICLHLLREGADTMEVRRNSAVLLFMDKMWDLVGRPESSDLTEAYSVTHILAASIRAEEESHG